MINSLILYFDTLSVFGKTAVVLNIVLLLIASFLFNYLAPSDSSTLNAKRTRSLRIMNLILLCVYGIDWLINFYFNNHGHSDVFIRISQTGLILVLGYLFTQFSHTWMIRKYGKERSVESEKVKTRTYQSEMGYILVLLVTLIVSILLLINIWQVTSWLQATGVIGGLLVILFGTKEAWAHDAVSGLILLYHGDITPGVVCRIPSMNILAVVRRMSLTETTFHDVIQKHNIIVSNSRLRAATIEVLNKVDSPHWNDFVTFKIGYDSSSEQVETYIDAVWNKACELEKHLDPQKKAKLVLFNPGDHAVEWRMNYRVESVYRIKQARFAINRAAFDLQGEYKVSLATPLTWVQADKQQLNLQ
ncbi:mechanosensitive ion channel domain-containing protein [Marinicella rhabdoformis]|uniref:mechanosensitive ion channel domain-containing protein n=1 Tax=Marinicella rhabdoformis TaxID=2580566 RepID=UPI0012AECA8C|nr:mechanosensitive ion channel domain-containing protein [Marinicella rhabdoformis]